MKSKSLKTTNAKSMSKQLCKKAETIFKAATLAREIANSYLTFAKGVCRISDAALYYRGLYVALRLAVREVLSKDLAHLELRDKIEEATRKYFHENPKGKKVKA